MMRGIDSTQPTKRSNAHLMLTTATGAALGAGARYVLPTKNEMQSFRTMGDTFFSNVATSARGSNRSILKYSVVGAVVAGGAYLLGKFFANKKPEQKYDDIYEFSRYSAIIDAPDIACEILLYDEI